MDAEGKVALMQDYSNVSANTDEKILNMAKKQKKTPGANFRTQTRRMETKDRIQTEVSVTVISHWNHNFL